MDPNRYCYDYMRVSLDLASGFSVKTPADLLLRFTLQKRGWNDAASRFAKEAGIKEDEWKGPPIEAPQGLLYE
jgi:hypothetical protein